MTTDKCQGEPMALDTVGVSLYETKESRAP